MFPCLCMVCRNCWFGSCLAYVLLWNETVPKNNPTSIWSLEISWSRMKQMEKEGGNTGIPCTLFSVTKFCNIYFHYCDYCHRTYFKWLITKSHLTSLLLTLQHHRFVCRDNTKWLEYTPQSFLLQSVSNWAHDIIQIFTWALSV